MRLAHSNPAVQDERVVGLPGLVNACESARMCQAVTGTDYELRKGVMRVEVGKSSTLLVNLFQCGRRLVLHVILIVSRLNCVCQGNLFRPGECKRILKHRL